MSETAMQFQQPLGSGFFNHPLSPCPEIFKRNLHPSYSCKNSVTLQNIRNIADILTSARGGRKQGKHEFPIGRDPVQPAFDPC